MPVDSVSWGVLATHAEGVAATAGVISLPFESSTSGEPELASYFALPKVPLALKLRPWVIA